MYSYFPIQKFLLFCIVIINSVENVTIDLYKALKNLGFDVDKNQKYNYTTFKDLSNKINNNYGSNKSDDFYFKQVLSKIAINK